MPHPCCRVTPTFVILLLLAVLPFTTTNQSSLLVSAESLSLNLPNPFSSIMAPQTRRSRSRARGQSVSRSSSTSNAPSALKELKDTIRKQKAQIERLEKQLASSSSSKNKSQSSAGAHGGHGAGEEMSIEEIAGYVAKPFYAVAMSRVGWLSIFLGSLSLTAIIMNGFEHTLSRQIELAYFVPLLAGHGGNTGGQTVGTVLSALSAGSISVNDAPNIVTKEALSGLMAGMILGSFVGPISYYIMGISLHVSVVIFCTLPLVSTIASSLGACIPFLCVFLGLDPSVIAAPAMTSFVDVSGLMAYFLIANQIFALFDIDL